MLGIKKGAVFYLKRQSEALKNLMNAYEEHKGVNFDSLRNSKLSNISGLLRDDLGDQDGPLDSNRSLLDQIEPSGIFRSPSIGKPTKFSIFSRRSHEMSRVRNHGFRSSTTHNDAIHHLS